MSIDHPNKELLSSEQLISAYKDMLTIRRFEERCGQAYGSGLIGGFCHLYIGQEAVVVGSKYAMSQGDSMITSYRDHGHIIALSGNLKSTMAELFGKETGCSKGKGGSMHMFDLQSKFFGGHGIVGAQSSLGTGIAFAEKYKGTKSACLTFMGDGAANQGQLYESMNMAKIFNLPVLYIIENNHYSMGTSINRGCANHERLFERGLGYGIYGKQVDGMDLFAVKSAVFDALSYVREHGPAILEMKTYRYRGHSMSDPAKYRTKEEVESFKNNYDPISNLLLYMEKFGIVDAQIIEKTEDEVALIVKESYDFALNSQEPNINELYSDVYR